MNKAVFWDRDGVLVQVLPIRDDGLKNVGPQKFEDLKLMGGSRELLDVVKIKGYLNIIVTNQPDIARNLVSWRELNRMHDFLKQNAPAIDAIYVCPHQDNDNCTCRKPKPGLLLDAAKDYKIDLTESFMVGDSQKDIDAAKAAGVKSILLKTHYNNQAAKSADFEVLRLKEIIDLLA